jgi:hypothetical protein
MKYLLVNEQLIPHNQFNGTKEEFGKVIGGFKYSTDEELYKLGFRDKVEPILGLNQQKGKPYLDAGNDVYTYYVVDIEVNINEIYNNKLNEFSNISDGYRDMLMRSSYENVLKGTVSQEFLDLVAVLETVKTRVKTALSNYLAANDIVALQNFSFITPEAEQLQQAILNFKQ